MIDTFRQVTKQLEVIEARLETALGRGEGDRGVGGGLQDHQGPEREEDKQGEGTHQTVKEGLDNRKDVTEKVEEGQAGPRWQDEEGDEGERGDGEGEGDEEQVVTNNRRMKKRVRVIEEENKEEEDEKVERVGRAGEGDNLRLRLTSDQCNVAE